MPTGHICSLERRLVRNGSFFSRHDWLQWVEIGRSRTSANGRKQTWEGREFTMIVESGLGHI
jgi:hypothetical protein